MTADNKLKFDDEEVSWTVANTSNIDIHLDKLLVMWPASNDSLEEVEFDDVEIFDGSIDGVSAAFNVAESFANDNTLRIDAGEKIQLEVEFDDDVLEVQDVYEIRMFFREGCTVEYPASAEVKFTGDSDRQAKRTYVSSIVGADALHWEGNHRRWDRCRHR